MSMIETVLLQPIVHFCHAMLCKRVCPSICHVRAFCQNELKYLQTFFTVG